MVPVDAAPIILGLAVVGAAVIVMTFGFGAFHVVLRIMRGGKK